MVSLLLSVLAWSDFTCLHHLLELVDSIINSLNLTSQDSVLRTEYQSFSVIHRPSARHALSRILRDSIFLMTGLCSDDIIGLANMV